MSKGAYVVSSNFHPDRGIWQTTLLYSKKRGLTLYGRVWPLCWHLRFRDFKAGVEYAGPWKEWRR